MGVKKARIDCLITDSGVGGAEKALFEIVTRLDGDRFSFRVIVMKRPGATARAIEAAGVPVLSLGLPPSVGAAYPLYLVPAFTKLVKELRTDPPDILHCWLFQANLLGRLAAGVAGVRANVSSLRVIERERLFQYPVDKLTRRLVTRYAAVSQAVADHYSARLGLKGEVTVIPNGVDVGPFLEADRTSLKKELGLPDDCLLIGSLGRLHLQKGVDLLIKAMPEILSLEPNVRLAIAGDGPERSALEVLTKDLGLEDKISFLGQYGDAAKFIAGLDLFVLPSRWEGMPNVALEAMAAGVPVVATEVDGTGEAVVAGGIERTAEGETAILVKPDDVGELARAAAALLLGRKRSEAMGRAGRERVSREFSISRMIERHRELYESLLR